MYSNKLSNVDYIFINSITIYQGRLRIENRLDLVSDLEHCLENRCFPNEKIQPEMVPKYFLDNLRERTRQIHADVKTVNLHLGKLPSFHYNLVSDNKILQKFELYFRLKLDFEQSTKKAVMLKNLPNIKKKLEYLNSR
jgi:hypothetical protein